jgi:hypothetical protein
MTQMQQMERAMLEQSNRKRATFLAKTAVAIMAAAMLVPLEPAALIPSDGGANYAICLQQFAYGGHNFEGGLGKLFPTNNREPAFLNAAAADIVIPRPAGVLAPQTDPIEPDSMRDLPAPISVSGRKIPIRHRNQKAQDSEHTIWPLTTSTLRTCCS